MTFQFSAAHLTFVNDAIADLDRRARKAPNDLAPAYNKALLLLSVGRFAEGWRLWERRLDLPECKESYNHFPVPRWDGGDLAGKHVLVWLEQGIGDHIMAASMLPDLMAIAGSVTLLTMRRLVPLMQRSLPAITAYKVGDPVSDRLRRWDFDCQMSVTDLGSAFRTSWDRFSGKPFLMADPDKVGAFQQKYKQTGKPLIGVSWKSENHLRGTLKSLTADDMGAILGSKDATFVNLQYGDCRAELASWRDRGLAIIDDPSVDQLLDMDTFAAQVAAMDMIVSTSNSLIHVAGALGVPTLAMIPMGHGRCWYWFSEMERSPWYGCVKLLRQSADGDWTPVIATAMEHVSALRKDLPCRAA